MYSALAYSTVCIYSALAYSTVCIYSALTYSTVWIYSALAYSTVCINYALSYSTVCIYSAFAYSAMHLFCKWKCKALVLTRLHNLWPSFPSYSVNLDQKPRSAASDLGLHYLIRPVDDISFCYLYFRCTGYCWDGPVELSYRHITICHWMKVFCSSCAVQ